MNQDLESVVKKIISEQLDLDFAGIRNEMQFAKDLKADSLDAVAILISLEEAFGVELSDEDSLKIKTVQNAIDIFTQYNLGSKQITL